MKDVIVVVLRKGADLREERLQSLRVLLLEYRAVHCVGRQQVSLNGNEQACDARL